MEAERGRESDVFVGIGSNVDPAANVRRAMAELRALGVLVAVSTLYRTPAVDGRGPAFINGVAHIRSRLDRPALLAGLADIEAVLGRQRSGDRHAPRTIDLDLLMKCPAFPGEEDSVHPDVVGRAFVAGPLAEIAPGLALPDGTLMADVAKAFEGKIGDPLPELTRDLRALAGT